MIRIFILFVSLFLSACTPNQTSTHKIKDGVDIAFASCIRPWDPQPAWYAIAAQRPKLFLFMGDNTYSDVGDYLKQPLPARIKQAYADQFSHDDFRYFLDQSKINDTLFYATWDDHDYGENDAGANFSHKLESKKVFSTYFPHTLAVHSDQEPGVYASFIEEMHGLQVQIILLDTRSFRSPLTHLKATPECPRVHLGPATHTDTDSQSQILGDKQWRWLEAQLAQPADLRLVISSIQVIPNQHCFEKWANFPHERDRLIALLTNAQPAVILSGDRHHAEISHYSTGGHSLYEITSSGLNAAIGHWGKIQKEDNRYRIGSDRISHDNFGSMTINKEGSRTTVKFKLHNAAGETLQQLALPLNASWPH